MEDIKITLHFDRSTKNKHLFKKADGSTAGLDNVYLNKDSVKGDVPDTIEVTISG